MIKKKLPGQRFSSPEEAVNALQMRFWMEWAFWKLVQTYLILECLKSSNSFSYSHHTPKRKKLPSYYIPNYGLANSLFSADPSKLSFPIFHFPVQICHGKRAIILSSPQPLRHWRVRWAASSFLPSQLFSGPRGVYYTLQEADMNRPFH